MCRVLRFCSKIFSITDPMPIRQKQIRLGWNVIGRKDSKGQPITAGNLNTDTPEFRKTLRIVMEAGIDAYGSRSHWIEEWTP